MSDETKVKNLKSKLQALNIFEGTWITQGTVHRGSGNKPAELRAVDVYEWLPGKSFMLHRVDAYMADAPAQSIEVMGYDTKRGGYVTRSYDDQGVTAEFSARLDGNSWEINGESVRFKGAFKANATKLAGTWEQLDADGKWASWMEIELIKVT